MGPIRRVVEILEVRVSIEGKPSAVMSAIIELRFSDQSREHREITFEPDGLLYEVWQDELRAWRRYIVSNSIN